MSRLDTVETKITTLLETIDGTDQGTYTYNTTTGRVQVFDEVLSLSRNTDYGHVNHILEQQEDVGVEAAEFQAGQYAFTQRVIYDIKSKVHNVGSEANAKNAIRTKMNELLDDLLYLFGNTYTLEGQVSWIKFKSAVREYEDITNNRIQSATLVTKWEVVYTQSIANPNVKSCA